MVEDQDGKPNTKKRKKKKGDPSTAGSTVKSRRRLGCKTSGPSGKKRKLRFVGRSGYLRYSCAKETPS